MELEKLFGLGGRVAIVTGGAGLYGRAISEGLCEAGATVIVASRSEAGFNESCAALAKKYPIRHMKLDIKDDASVAELISGVESEYGKIDILVNNAVTPPFARSIADSSGDDWRAAFSGNAASMLVMSREAAAGMVQRKSGVIINISSIWGIVAPDYGAYEIAKQSPNPIAYGFIKGGVNMFTRSLASQLAPHGVRVNAISPGGIADDTDTEVYRKIYLGKVPLGRWAQPEDIKGAVVYLASDSASYVTGENIVIDGGYTIR